MKKFPFVLLLSLTCLAGCSSPAPESSSPLNTEVTSPSAVDNLNGEFPVVQEDEPRVSYQASFVENDLHEDAKVYKDTLAYFCLTTTIYDTEEYVTNQLTKAHFENIRFVSNNNYGETGHCLASRKMNGFYLILALCQSMEYRAQWGDNLRLGAHGDPEGWTEETAYFINRIEDYMKGFDGYKTKILITGYSRGAAVTSLTAASLSKQNKYGWGENDIYAYAFEGPDHAEEEGNYPFIHDIHNSEDFVVHMLPKAYGFKRHGTHKDIGGTDLYVRAMNATFPDYPVAAFNGKGYFENNEAFIDGIGKMLTDPFPEYANYSLETRDDYVKNVQDGLSTLMAVLFQNGTTYLLESLKGFEMGMSQILVAISSEANFRSFIQSVFDYAHFVYTDAQLDIITSQLYVLGYNLASYRLDMIMKVAAVMKENATYVAHSHYPETTYALLKYQG